MFADRARIFIRSGKGGDGHVSFRRELYVPDGGPDGGDGGKGGDLIFVVDPGLNTLVDYRHKRKYCAGDGKEGSKKRCTGASGEDMILKVPAGTVVKDAETGKVILDMANRTEPVVLLKGGRGGKGNQHYATATMQAPKYAQPGQRARELWVDLELKVIADVGLIGFPNVGKSTLLSRVTNARPKIANYHFTTLNPNLGVVDLAEGNGFVIADIPGIIEGASEGVGLGIQFLKHVERTRLLLHVLDAAGSEGRNPVEDFNKINDELKNYSQILSQKKQIVVANKMDIANDDTLVKEIEKLCEEKNLKLFKISAATKEGIDELIEYVAQELKTIPKEDIVQVDEMYGVEDETVDQEWNISKEQRKDGIYYIVTGAPIERLMSKVNVFDIESRQYMQKVLKQLGVIDRLKEMGITHGDYIEIEGYQLEYSE